MTNAVSSDNFTIAAIAYRYQCSACDVQVVEAHRIYRQQEIPNACVPAGWKRMGWEFFCPAHEVGLMIDGEERGLLSDF